MQHGSSRKANSRSQLVNKIPRLLRNMKVHYSVDNGPPLALIVRQMGPDHTLPRHLFIVHFNIISSNSRSIKRSLPFRGFRPKSCMYFLYLPWLHSPLISSCTFPFNTTNLCGFRSSTFLWDILTKCTHSTPDGSSVRL